jgi:flagellar biosynthesis chaperone FliJ
VLISTDTEKSFHKDQHSFLIKPLHDLYTKGNFLNMMKTIYAKLTSNIMTNGGKNLHFSSKIRYKAKMVTLTTSIQHNSGNTRKSNKIRKNKKHSNQKERHKNYPYLHTA